MQSYSSPSAVGYGAEPGGGEQHVQNHMFSVPTQNSFAPLQDWVGVFHGCSDARYWIRNESRAGANGNSVDTVA